MSIHNCTGYLNIYPLCFTLFRGTRSTLGPGGHGKMTEVSHRLSRAYKLSVFRQAQCRLVHTVEMDSPLGRWTPFRACAHRGARESVQGLCENKPLSETKEITDSYSKTRRLCGIESPCTNKTISSWGLVSLDSGAYPCKKWAQNTQVQKSPLYVSPSVEPVLHVRLIVGRVACWSRTGYVPASSLHIEAFISLQQFREFSTFILKQTEQGNGILGNKIRSKKLKHYLHSLEHEVFTRGYSRNNANGTTEVAPLYRNRTAYYDILKVSPNATQSQIKTSYYKQSFLFHPDKNPGNEATQRFSEISEAYTVLGNISLRRKYDCGILSLSDIQGAGRPSSKETASRAPGPQQHQQQKHKSMQFSQGRGKPMFDFDAFYQAHYGEQLRRERQARARKEWFKQKQKENFEKWKLANMMELTIGVLAVVGGIILISVFH